MTLDVIVQNSIKIHKHSQVQGGSVWVYYIDFFIALNVLNVLCRKL